MNEVSLPVVTRTVSSLWIKIMKNTMLNFSGSIFSCGSYVWAVKVKMSPNNYLKHLIRYSKLYSCIKFLPVYRLLEHPLYFPSVEFAHWRTSHIISFSYVLQSGGKVKYDIIGLKTTMGDHKVSISLGLSMSVLVYLNTVCLCPVSSLVHRDVCCRVDVLFTRDVSEILF